MPHLQISCLFGTGVLLTLFVCPVWAEPQVVPLWSEGAPGFEDRRNEPEQAQDYWVKNIHNPSITVFLPPTERATGAAVLVLPGGGHKELVFQAEGTEPAEWLNELGVAAFVLKYRLAREKDSPYSLNVHPRQDAQRAMRVIRSRAKEWIIDPARIGMLGFSAGGELVALATYPQPHTIHVATDEVDRVDAEPNFVMIIYPGPLGMPKAVPAEAPPAFLLVSDDDWSHVDGVVELLAAYRKVGASVEAHIYARGEHGYNLGFRSNLPSIKNWPGRMSDWMTDNFILDPQGQTEYLARRTAERDKFEKQRAKWLERRRRDPSASPQK
jgi:acetyl esterase/lipase